MSESVTLVPPGQCAAKQPLTKIMLAKIFKKPLVIKCAYK